MAGRVVRFELINEAGEKIGHLEGPKESTFWKEAEVGDDIWSKICVQGEEGSVAFYVNPEKVAAIARFEREAPEPGVESTATKRYP